MSEADNLALLNQQRAKRPSSPWHIYQPQLTSISSIANRATGAGLSVGEFRTSRFPLFAPISNYADWSSSRTFPSLLCTRLERTPPLLSSW